MVKIVIGIKLPKEILQKLLSNPFCHSKNDVEILLDGLFTGYLLKLSAYSLKTEVKILEWPDLD
ncbi:MAG: hypothetical protein ABIN18_05630 [Pseudomonadota bacterium]